GLKASGGFYSNSSVAGPNTFEQLQNYIGKLIQNAGIEITNGDVTLNPFRHKQQIACTYCPFLSFCQFDSVLEENKFKRLKEMKDQEVLDKIAGEGGTDG